MMKYRLIVKLPQMLLRMHCLWAAVMNNKNKSILLLGPTGSGKSSFIAQALRHYGSGAVALAPGVDEKNSYGDMLENSAYAFQGFEEVNYQPYLGRWTTNAMRDAVLWLEKIRDEVQADVASGKPPRYAVLALDTASGLARYAYNVTMAQLKLLQPPAAKSPEGAAFYSVLKLTQESLYRPIRAIYGTGVNIIAAAHVTENENISDAAVTEKAAKVILPDVPGGFKTVLPSFFDLVFHTMILRTPQGVQHVLQWKPDARRPTKSRLGSLGESALIPNDFLGVLARLEKLESSRR